MERRKKVVIIGAGPAGLTAANEFLKGDNNIHPIILEESEYIGGISRTATYKGNRMDIGGHRFFSKDDRVNEIWEELLPLQGAPSKDDKDLGIEKPLSPNGPDPEKTDLVMLYRNRVSRIYFLHKFFDYPISLKWSTIHNMGFGRTMKAGFGYLGAKIHRRKETNLENFYINRFGKPLYQMFFEDYTEKLWGVHPSKISADWGAQRVKGLSISKAIGQALKKAFHIHSKKTETSLIEQFKYPKKGPGELYETMAKRIEEMGGEIHMKQKVNGFTFAEDGSITAVKAVDEQGNITTYDCEDVISSMPIKDLLESIGEERVGKEVYKIGTNLPYRDFLTVGLLIDHLKVKNKTKVKTFNDLIPDNWIYVQDREVRLGRIQVFNNWSPYMVEDYKNKVWLGLEYFCSEGDKMWAMPDKDFIEKAKQDLITIGMIDSDKNVLDAMMIHVKKAYPAYFGTYKDFPKVRAYLDSIPNLYCVGRNGQHRYNNMDHSMVTAIEATKVILSGSKDKTPIWSVNTEKEYHEEKEDETKKEENKDNK